MNEYHEQEMIRHKKEMERTLLTPDNEAATTMLAFVVGVMVGACGLYALTAGAIP